MQLNAGEEHAIQGKTVRVNRAGPRPALLRLAVTSDPGRPGISHASSAPMSGGVSRQRGGHSTSEPSTSSNMLQNLGTLLPDLGITLPDLLCAASISTFLPTRIDVYAMLIQVQQATLHATSAAAACYLLAIADWHDSECLSLPDNIREYCNSSSCMLAGSAAGSDNNGSGTSESGPRPTVPQGAGPRIYVGGIPNAVSETMVRVYFSNWGKVRSRHTAVQPVVFIQVCFCHLLFALAVCGLTNAVYIGHQLLHDSATNLAACTSCHQSFFVCQIWHT